MMLLLGKLSRYKTRKILATAALFLSLGMGQAAATGNDPAFAQNLQQWLGQSTLQFDQVAVPTAPLQAFYQGRSYQPVWVSGTQLNRQAQTLLATIERAGEDGLNPERYGVSIIHRLTEERSDTAARRLQVSLSLEAMLSHALIRYANDVYAGVARPQWQTGQQPMNDAQLAGLLQQVSGSANLAAALQSLAPQTQDYAALKAALKQYQSIAAQGGWPSFTVGKTIKPGMRDSRVATLRQILTITGDLPASTAMLTEPIYSKATVEAVKHFQKRHAIEADGVLGKSTQQALAEPVSKRIEQLALTLERMRWMPRDMGSRYVLVNVPAYRLRAVSGAHQMQMDVIVGKTDSKTPMFSKNITQVVLNPSWGVPTKIAVKEMLPKIQNNPDYLVNAGYTVTQNGEEIDPSDVDWSSVERSNFAYNFRQKPGAGNALGKVKFMIPDSDNIYLHDTASPKLFARSERSLSHGCVRLSDPKALTQFVLTDAGWNAAKIAQAYNNDTPRTIAVTPLPVHLVYWTSWVDSDGTTHFGRDIYGMDRSLLAAIDRQPKKAQSVTLAMN